MHLTVCGSYSLGLWMAFRMEFDKAGLGYISFLTCSQVARHIAFLFSDNEMPLRALPECCLGNLLPLGTSSGTVSTQAPAWCHLVDKNTPCATSLPRGTRTTWLVCSVHRGTGKGRGSRTSRLATQAFKPVRVLLEAILCTEGV